MTELLADERPLDATDLRRAAILTLFAIAVRAAYLVRLDVPPYDPWRHLALVRSLREGLGFTLFDDQPYIWYSPVWYVLCAALPPAIGPEWLAGLLSVLAVPGLYLVGRRHAGRVGALVAAALLASCGPVVAFTCHYGPEALALALVVGGLALVASRPSSITALAAGLALGTATVLRANFALNAFLALPWIARPPAATAFAAGFLAPLGAAWWRNRRIVGAHPWVFTWDGLATRSADFDWLSTLLVQMHPSVREGLRRLHEMLVPVPEWLVIGGRPNWGSIVFLGTGLACAVLARRPSLALAGVAPVAYFLVLDRTLSANFFRIYLAVFPALFLAIGAIAASLAERSRRPRLALAVALLPVIGGIPLLSPPPMGSLDALTPGADLLTESRYLVPSAGFYPESLIWKFPDRRFLGLPIDPADLPEFLAAYPSFRAVLLHDFTVQPEIERALLEDPVWRLARTAWMPDGRQYRVLERSDPR